eukprot:7905332-Pyramimonas_sp.AAC.1
MALFISALTAPRHGRSDAHLDGGSQITYSAPEVSACAARQSVDCGGAAGQAHSEGEGALDRAIQSMPG